MMRRFTSRAPARAAAAATIAAPAALARRLCAQKAAPAEAAAAGKAAGSEASHQVCAQCGHGFAGGAHGPYFHPAYGFVPPGVAPGNVLIARPRCFFFPSVLLSIFVFSMLLASTRRHSYYHEYGYGPYGPGMVAQHGRFWDPYGRPYPPQAMYLHVPEHQESRPVEVKEAPREA